MKARIVIVGLGLIGGSLAKALKEYTDSEVLAIDTNKESLAQAISAKVIDREASEEDLAKADILFLCIYPQAAIDFVKNHIKYISKKCIVTDTCGIKTVICAEMTELARKHHFTFIGGHPMAGREVNGFEASQVDLFQDASYILIAGNASEEDLQSFGSFVMNLGFGKVILTTAQHHDSMIAYTSQLPHILACAYVLSPNCLDHKGFSAGSYRDVSRVAKMNEELWTELFLENRVPLTKELDILIENIQQLKIAIEKNETQTLKTLLQKGRERKEKLGE